MPDYAWTGVSTAGTIPDVTLLQPHPPPVRVDGPILFDEAVRNALRDRTTPAHDEASTIGWVGMIAVLAYPVVVDIPIA